MSKKLTIHISNEFQEQLEELASILGIRQTYGEVPRTLKFSITYTIQEIKKLSKVIPTLKGAELDILFSSIKRLRERAEKLENLEKAQKEAEK